MIVCLCRTPARLLAAGWLFVAYLLASPPAVAKPPVTALEFTRSGDGVLVGSQAGVGLYSWPEMQLRFEIPGVPQSIHAMKFDRAGQQLAVAGGVPGEAGSVSVYEWTGSGLVPDSRWSKRFDDDVIYSLAWSDDGYRMATAGLGGVAILLDARSGETLLAIDGHSAGLTGVAWVTADTILTASRDHTIRVWSRHGGQLVRTLDQHTDQVLGVETSPADGLARPLVASIGRDRTARFWQPDIGRLVRFHRLSSGRPVCLAWSPAGDRLVVGTTAGDLLEIDPATSAVVRSDNITSGWVTAVTVAPDGNVLAGTSDGQLVTRLR